MYQFFFLLLYVHTIFNVCKSMAVFYQNPVKFFSARKVKREPNLISRLNSKERAEKVGEKKKKYWQRWDSNPRHRNDWCLKPAP